MIRLFVALPLPDAVAQSLFLVQSGLHNARWRKRENLHITLRFIGEVENHIAAEIDDMLSAIKAPGFDVQLHGMGSFGGRNPHSVWAGVAPDQGLNHLQRKIEAALQRIGLPPEQRKFKPHVTLGKLRATPRQDIINYLADHALFSTASFTVKDFTLYSSHLSPNGSLYTPERVYPLT